jgi:hypothetical protein
MVHDTISSCEHQVTEATGRKDVLHPLLNILRTKRKHDELIYMFQPQQRHDERTNLDGDVESRRDDTALVDSADKLDDDLARSVVIDDLEFTDVSYHKKHRDEEKQQIMSNHEDWQIINSNSMYSPFFCITCKNLTTTLEEGLMMTWRFPRFSALERVFKQSAKTDIFVI